VAYREAPTQPRFFCIVCYRSLSVYAGLCPTCGVPRLDLDEPEVRAQVRAEVERRLQRRMSRELTAVAATSAALCAPAFFFIGSFAAVLVAPVALVVGGAYTAVNRKSALAAYAARRRRVSKDLGVDASVMENASGAFDERAGARGEDPGALEFRQLLDWLGARVDDR
jgi:hypothetical protein